MKKQEIIDLINAKHDILFDWLDRNAEQYWDFGLPSKWTTGQIILHLIQSENALNKGLRVPKFLLRYNFGKPNRPVRSYEEIVQRYQDKLSKVKAGVLSPFSQEMNLTEGNADAYINMLRDEHKRMIGLVERKWNDKKLSLFLLPHPLLGRMHVTEILMWTAYHTEHHYLQIKERAESKTKA